MPLEPEVLEEYVGVPFKGHIYIYKYTYSFRIISGYVIIFQGSEMCMFLVRRSMSVKATHGRLLSSSIIFGAKTKGPSSRPAWL